MPVHCWSREGTEGSTPMGSPAVSLVVLIGQGILTYPPNTTVLGSMNVSSGLHDTRFAICNQAMDA